MVIAHPFFISIFYSADDHDHKRRNVALVLKAALEPFEIQTVH